MSYLRTVDSFVTLKSGENTEDRGCFVVHLGALRLMRTARPSLPLATALLALVAQFAGACQVPVFRYALERWAPAEYRLTITPAEAGLSAEEKRGLDQLRATITDETAPLNLAIEIAPPSGSGPAQMALNFPLKPREPAKPPIWQGPFTVESVQQLIDSPVRQEIRKRLLAGESAVWVLIESGDHARDDKAFAALTTALGEAQVSLKLPDGVVTPSAAAGRAQENAEVLRTDLPLQIAFSTLRVPRGDAKEAALLAMLTHLEDDLGGYTGEPMVFPVFGRGRALEPLIGAGIHRDNVVEHSGYLCGACSCEVKDQNPGVDLLIAANWSPVDTTPKVEIIRIAPGTPAPASTVPTKAAPRFPLVPFGAGALGLAALLLILKRSRQADDLRPR